MNHDALTRFETFVRANARSLVTTAADAEAAGRDARQNGPNSHNTNLRFFCTAELLQAWERGNQEEPRP